MQSDENPVKWVCYERCPGKAEQPSGLAGLERKSVDSKLLLTETFSTESIVMLLGLDFNGIFQIDF